MNNILKNIESGFLILLFSPILLIGIIVFLIVIYINHRKKRKWLNQNDYTYFLIHTTGKTNKEFFENTVIPALSAGTEIVIFDGMDFHGFINSKIVKMLMLYDNNGFPIIGKIENGKIKVESLKVEYKAVS